MPSYPADSGVAVECAGSKCRIRRMEIHSTSVLQTPYVSTEDFPHSHTTKLEAANLPGF